ncbi:hypothetical protein PVAP13_2KG215200 [Panicum virgatum]|uniref:CCAAT-binding factor domain-containing protein n=1 Tax=Panicum virgatum TaxID=38727 RepID=A0A8T0WDP4_PANVG|nr:hypothetical protein PVAP13_2KG215200 [Panicum virgatum]
MAEPNPKSKRTKKSKKPSAGGGGGEDLDAIKSDVATFASTLGFLPGAGGSSGGFDDSDFRKSGPMKKPPKPPSEQPQQTPENTANPHQNPKPAKKPHPLELHGPLTATKPGAATTNYPLMKAAALSGQWYADAGELEARVLGGRKQVPPAVGLQEMQGMVERKRELAEKLMAQYAREYDTVRRGHGDLKLLEISAKSGTSADKVSAFTCLVEDNPIANMRALDSLLGMVTSKVGKRYAFTGFDALKELFLVRLLPDRKLKSLIQRPLDILPETKDGYSLLLFWHWEDCLKQRYEKFVMSLEDAVKDMLPNLKDKAMKNDVMLKRVSAFSKRLLQVALQRPPQYACGCLFILSEVLKAKSPLWAIVLQNESVDDGDEHFEDIVESPEDSSVASAALDKHTDKSASHEKCNIDAADGSDSVKQMELIERDENGENNASVEASRLHALYDPRHREPSYCNADRVSWWELTVLASHVHPSVSTMARTLLSGNNIVYSGDPLTDLSLPAFLDKFMEKKPKGNRIAEGRWHGGSQIAPAKKLDMNHRLIGEELLDLAENEVPPEDIVFHRFYMNKSGPIKPKAKKGSVLDEDTGELLADNADDAEDGEYDYDDLDSNAFDEEKDLLRDDSDVELDDISDSASMDGSENDDDDIDSFTGMDAEALEAEGDSDGNSSDEEMVDAGNGSSSHAKKKMALDKRKNGVKSGRSPFASLDDYEHLMVGDEDETALKRKRKATGRAGGEKKPKSRSKNKRSRSLK